MLGLPVDPAPEGFIVGEQAARDAQRRTAAQARHVLGTLGDQASQLMGGRG